MREIASRSRAIVSAGNCVHELHHELNGALTHIRVLRENVGARACACWSGRCGLATA